MTERYISGLLAGVGRMASLSNRLHIKCRTFEDGCLKQTRSSIRFSLRRKERTIAGPYQEDSPECLMRYGDGMATGKDRIWFSGIPS